METRHMPNGFSHLNLFGESRIITLLSLPGSSTAFQSYGFKSEFPLTHADEGLALLEKANEICCLARLSANTYVCG